MADVRLQNFYRRTGNASYGKGCELYALWRIMLVTVVHAFGLSSIITLVTCDRFGLCLIMTLVTCACFGLC